MKRLLSLLLSIVASTAQAQWLDLEITNLNDKTSERVAILRANKAFNSTGDSVSASITFKCKNDPVIDVKAKDIHAYSDYKIVSDGMYKYAYGKKINNGFTFEVDDSRIVNMIDSSNKIRLLLKDKDSSLFAEFEINDKLRDTEAYKKCYE